MSRRWLAAMIGVTLATRPAAGSAQLVPAGTPAVRPESASVVPSTIYKAGAVGRYFFGDHYRDLWATQLRVPLLSLDRFAGGLRPLKRGGSRQTKSLRFAGVDGSEYVFRSVDKDPSVSLPPELRGTVAHRIVRDLISAAHPGAALVVAELLDAVGILHATPQLAVMPDDPRLGEFRQEFAGMLGLIEERPTTDADDDAPPSERVLSSEKLIDRITEHPREHVDARAYVTARLFDIFVGDWDRHPDQWRWVRLGGSDADGWRPIPRDRDWALVRLDGLVWSLARFTYPFPQFVSFDAEYPDIVWLTWNGRRLDRHLLSELDVAVWDSVAVALRDQLSDTAIDAAIARLPAPLAAASGGDLRRQLIARRDALPSAARRFYDVLADQVDVHATDDRDVVDIIRGDARYATVEIRQAASRGSSDRVWFRRTFDARSTREIRVYLHGGDDRVVVRGNADNTIVVRAVGGEGRDTFATEGATASRVRFYDGGKNSVLEGDASPSIDTREYKEPKTRRGWIDPPRDWGSRWRPLPWVSYAPMAGFFVGGGPIYKQYGFREDPYSYRAAARVGYATTANKWRVEYDGEVRRANSNIYGTLLARYSGLDILRFYGFGNQTQPTGSSTFHAVQQQVLSLEPLLHLPLAKHLDLSLGAGARYTTTKLDGAHFIDLAQPYGIGHFGQVSARQGLTYDSRDVPANATRGAFVTVQGAEYPGLGTHSAFGQLRSQAAAYLGGPGPLKPVLALRAGGEKLWGEFPYSDAAFVGGASTVRGFAEQRFAGDASAYGNAELRFFLTKVFLLLPGELGGFGLADAGRVYRAQETSDTWHSALGGGLWISFLERANTFSVSWARGREGSGVYFKMGMQY